MAVESRICRGMIIHLVRKPQVISRVSAQCGEARPAGENEEKGLDAPFRVAVRDGPDETFIVDTDGEALYKNTDRMVYFV